MRSHHIIAAAASIAFVACSETSGADNQPAVGPTQQPAVTAQSTTTGGDGSPIRLSPLTASEIEAADLEGELACSFADAGGETLLLAMGDVASDDRAFGVVKVADSVESVSAPGGFDGMLRGATFVGKGKTVEVERTSSQPVGGGESPPYPATLTYQRADGASRTFEGLWTCGP